MGNSDHEVNCLKKVLSPSKRRVIFECDNELPQSLENIINVFRVIKRIKKEDKCDFERIVALMRCNYTLDENETKRCIASLYFDGVIDISQDLNRLLFFVKSHKNNYPANLKEKIRLISLSHICQMYIALNLHVINRVSSFSIEELMRYFIQTGFAISRVRITEDLLCKTVDKLSRFGYLNKEDNFRYSLTNKGIKFGLRIEEFNKYCKDVKIERNYRQRQSKTVKDKDITMIKSTQNDIIPKICTETYTLLQDVNCQSLPIQQILPNFSACNNVNVMNAIIDVPSFNQTIFPIALKAIPIFPQIIHLCNVCGQGPNENGLLCNCRGCGIHAHIICKQFFNCFRDTHWCSICKHPFQTSVEKFEDVSLLCRDCFKHNQNSFNVCLSCQQSIYLQNDIKSEVVENIPSNNIMPEQNYLHKDIVSHDDRYVPSSLSFVEMLNHGEEIASYAEYEKKSASLWTVSDVEKWLTDEGYGNLCSKFRKEEIDGSSLLLLLESDLRLIKIEEKYVPEIFSKIVNLR